MPRPRLGDAAKTEVICVRATIAEREALEAKYGTAAKGLRAILSANLQPKESK